MRQNFGGGCPADRPASEFIVLCSESIVALSGGGRNAVSVSDLSAPVSLQGGHWTLNGQ